MIVLKGSETIAAAAKVMRSYRIGCVVIVAEGQKPVGIFSERDLLRVVADGLDVATTRVKDVMTPDPVTVDAAEPLESVFGTLAKGRFRHLPITDNGRLIGIISLSDIAGVLREVFLKEQYAQYLVDYLRK